MSSQTDKQYDNDENSESILTDALGGEWAAVEACSSIRHMPLELAQALLFVRLNKIRKLAMHELIDSQENLDAQIIFRIETDVLSCWNVDTRAKGHA